MKTPKFIALAAVTLLLSQCKSTAPTASSSSEPSFLEVTRILDSTQIRFDSYEQQTSGDPAAALELTKAWVAAQPTVASVDDLDSVYLTITLKSGLQTTFYYSRLDSAGFSSTRGGHALKGKPKWTVPSLQSTHLVANKNVLLFVPALAQFYTPGQIQHLQNLFAKSGLGLNVTLLSDQQCTFSTLDHFKDYGLVILDTHGTPNGFLVGDSLHFAASDTTAYLIKQAIIAQIGQDGYNHLLAGELGFSRQNSVASLFPFTRQKALQLWASSKYVTSLGSLSGTIVFGNMCYSGWQAPIKSGTPIGTAFQSLSPISYYGYQLDDLTSAGVNNYFSIDAEDSLVTALVVKTDSTGDANRDSQHSILFDPTFHKQSKPTYRLRLLQFGPLDYSYQGCVDSFIDARDGQMYRAVCIGGQNWMAQNLNYAAPGSRCYADTADYCSTYGRLYDWSTMMQGAAASNANPSGVQGVCPKGWHVPSLAEWNQMIAFLGGSDIAGGALRSTSALWDTSYSGFSGVPATNSSGFSALPAGYGDLLGSSWGTIGYQTAIGTASADSSGSVVQYYWMELDYNSLAVTTQREGSTIGNSCRCVKDP